MFREAVLHFLGVKEEKDPVETYCKACRAAKMDDCGSCSKDIRVIDLH